MFKTFHIETISVDYYCLEPNGIFCLFCFKDRNSKINSKQNSAGCRDWQKYFSFSSLPRSLNSQNEKPGSFKSYNGFIKVSAWHG